MRRSVLLLLCLAIGAVAAVSFALKRARSAAAMRRGIDLSARLAAANVKFHSEVRPLLQEYCWDCHGDGADKGGVTLDAFTNATQVFQQRALWERVLDNVRTGAMPPAKKKQPEEAKRQQLMAWLDHVLYPIDPDNPDPGRVTVRRLNRTEYNNTVRDLLGVEFQPAADFPQDDVGYGFDNIGDVLSMPPVLLEKYLGAAQTLMDEVLPTGPPKPPSRLFGPAQIQGHDHVGELYALVDGDREVFVDFLARQPGEYLFQVTAFGKQLPDRISKERVKMAFRLGTGVLATNDVAAKSENPRNYEIRVPLSEGTNRFRVAFLNDREEVEVKQETRPSGRVADITNRFDRDLCVNSIRVTGPFTDVLPPTPFQQWLLGVGPALGSLTNAPENAESVLERFASRAFRRPATREEVQRLVEFYRVARLEQPYLPALRHALTAVLVSPHFLFRGEFQPEPDNPRAIHLINEYALAARLSYFLWSSMPDETLTGLAARGQLRAGLPGEIRRLLRDPKSRALTDNFAGQWLQLRLLDLASPDKVKFPDFDEYLRHSMLTETEMLFDQIVRHDRPVTDFLTADYTFVNERLARHYGLTDVKGNEFRQVSLAGSPRGGVLTHASFLTFSSNPTRTSPVKRGKWVLDNLLGMPPPPPPPNVPELGERNLKGTLRQRLEEHRDNAMCASCHARMDPIGFALEHFDAVGRYREKDGENAIDSADKLHTGETFQDHRDLRQILANAHAADFARTLSEKLLTYALGRGLEWYDRPTLQQLQTRLAKSEYRFSELVIAIAESTPFQRRRGEGDPLADPVVVQTRADGGAAASGGMPE